MTDEDRADAQYRKVCAASGHLGILEVAVSAMRQRHERGAEITQDFDRLERVLAELRADLGLSPLLTKAGR